MQQFNSTCEDISWFICALKFQVLQMSSFKKNEHSTEEDHLSNTLYYFYLINLLSQLNQLDRYQVGINLVSIGINLGSLRGLKSEVDRLFTCFRKLKLILPSDNFK